MISNTTGIPWNLQGQATVERTNRALKELLARAIYPEARQDPHLVLTEVLFYMKCLNFDDKRPNMTYKKMGISAKEHIPAPDKMERFPSPSNGSHQAPWLTCEWGYTCVLFQTPKTPIWVLVRDVCPAVDQPSSTCLLLLLNMLQETF